MKRSLVVALLGFGAGIAFLGAAHAGKGDRVLSVPRGSPILERKVLDLRFADFAQGIWASDVPTCQRLEAIDAADDGTAVAVFRGLIETPDRICLVYGAETGSVNSQRAALNCDLESGEEALGLITLRRSGKEGLLIQDGTHEPRYFQFCKPILPVTRSVTQ